MYLYHTNIFYPSIRRDYLLAFPTPKYLFPVSSVTKIAVMKCDVTDDFDIPLYRFRVSIIFVKKKTQPCIMKLPTFITIVVVV